MRTTLAAQDTEGQPRLFPAPDPGTGCDRGQTEESARRLLLFVDRRFTFAQRVFGWNLDPETRLGRVLLLRRQAFEAERAGAFRTADFHWVEAHRALKNAVVDPVVWRHALEIGAFAPAITVEILRTRFVQELFIDLHRWLFDSRRPTTRSSDPSDRAFVHCIYVERLVDLAGFDAAKSAVILRPMVDAWLSACREAGECKRAIRICRRLARRFAPDATYLDELVVCLLRMTTDRLTRPPGSFTLTDARHLRVGIRDIERVCETHGPTGLVLAALARLHAMYAVALANSGDYAEALVEIGIAIDYGGDNAYLRRTRDELAAAMRNILRNADNGRSAAQRGGSRRPSRDAQASKGFGPFTEYQRSQRSARIRDLRRAAVGA
jgi:hypothetical protein